MLFLFYIYSSTATGQSLITEGVLSVLGNPSDAMMRDYFRELTDRQFTLRDSLLNSLRSAEEWDMRAQTIRDSMISWTGPLPERTPLNARTTGKLQRDG